MAATLTMAAPLRGPEWDRPEPSGGLCTRDGVRDAYHAHGGALYRFAVQSLHDRGLAEDAVQETFVRAWRNCDRFDASVASLRTWLFAIVRNIIIDMARARAVRPAVGPVSDQGPGQLADLTDHTEAIVTARLLADALARISAEHRVAIVETHYRGRPYAEVAVELGIPIGTLRSRVFYGLRTLRLALEELGWMP